MATNVDELAELPLMAVLFRLLRNKDGDLVFPAVDENGGTHDSNIASATTIRIARRLSETFSIVSASVPHGSAIDGDANTTGFDTGLHRRHTDEELKSLTAAIDASPPWLIKAGVHHSEETDAETLARRKSAAVRRRASALSRLGCASSLLVLASKLRGVMTMPATVFARLIAAARPDGVPPLRQARGESQAEFAARVSKETPQQAFAWDEATAFEAVLSQLASRSCLYHLCRGPDAYLRSALTVVFAILFPSAANGPITSFVRAFLTTVAVLPPGHLLVPEALAMPLCDSQVLKPEMRDEVYRCVGQAAATLLDPQMRYVAGDRLEAPPTVWDGWLLEHPAGQALLAVLASLSAVLAEEQRRMAQFGERTSSPPTTGVDAMSAVGEFVISVCSGLAADCQSRGLPCTTSTRGTRDVALAVLGATLYPPAAGCSGPPTDDLLLVRLVQDGVSTVLRRPPLPLPVCSTWLRRWCGIARSRSDQADHWLHGVARELATTATTTTVKQEDRQPSIKREKSKDAVDGEAPPLKMHREEQVFDP